MDLTPELWEQFKGANSYSRIRFDDLLPDDKESMNRVLRFGQDATFEGITYKAVRGYSRFRYHNFAEYSGFRPRVLLWFKFEGKSRAFETRTHGGGLENFVQVVFKELGHAKWIETWNKPGAVCKSYINRTDGINGTLINFKVSEFNSRLKQNYEIAKAKEAVRIYVTANQSVSKKFRNHLVKFLSETPDPDRYLEMYLSLAKAVKEVSGEYNSTELVKLVRSAYHSRDEFPQLTEQDKSEVLSLSKVGRVHRH